MEEANSEESKEVQEKKMDEPAEKKEETQHVSQPVKTVSEAPKTNMMIDNNPDKKGFSQMAEEAKKNPWMVASIILGIIVVILLISNFRGGTGVSGNVISVEDAGAKIVEYLNTRTGGGVEYVSSEETGDNLYEVLVSYQGSEIPVYVTKDGEYFVQGATPLDAAAQETQTQTQPAQTNVPKSDKPVVELFVMSYCPYGTQAEKGILPVVALLGDKIDFKLRTVHYVLHGDKEDLENKRELCIREEQGQNILNKYLVCILDSDNAQAPADVTECEKEAGVDSEQLETCMEESAEDYFAADSELSEGYGVRGSPTLIINGVQSSAGRSPASYLKGICDAFNEAPEECSEQLSTAGPSAGFGYNEGTDTVAQC